MPWGQAGLLGHCQTQELQIQLLPQRAGLGCPAAGQPRDNGLQTSTRWSEGNTALLEARPCPTDDQNIENRLMHLPGPLAPALLEPLLSSVSLLSPAAGEGGPTG